MRGKRHLSLVVSRSEPQRPAPKTVHLCPDCGRRIVWALELCALCSWRGEPFKNSEWFARERTTA